MNERQKRFCEYFAANPDGTAAALAAGYSARSAASIGSENLRKPELLSYIRELQDLDAESRIAGLKEAKALLSDVMRNKTQRTSDRLRAAELLLRSGGALVRIREDEDGRTIEAAADEGSAIVILPTGDGKQGPEKYSHLVSDELRRDGWMVID